MLKRKRIIDESDKIDQNSYWMRLPLSIPLIYLLVLIICDNNVVSKYKN